MIQFLKLCSAVTHVQMVRDGLWLGRCNRQPECTSEVYRLREEEERESVDQILCRGFPSKCFSDFKDLADAVTLGDVGC
jgi:hypothetical protein